MSKSNGHSGENAIIDKSDISHKEMKRFMFNAGRVAKLIESGDMDTAEQLTDDVDRFLERMVVYVPSSWFVSSAPEGISADDPGFTDYLQQDRYDELQALLTPQPGNEGN